MRITTEFFNSRTRFVESFLSGRSFKILDVGNLGDGEVNVDIRGMTEKSGGEYWGLDSNDNLAQKLGFKNQLVGDLHNLKSVNDGQFDCVYMGEVIEHTWRPGDMLKECRRILKEGGYLLLDTPNVYNLVSIIRYLFKKEDFMGDSKKLVYEEALDNMKNLRSGGELLTQPQHKIFYSPAMLDQLLSMHGLKVEKMVFIGKPRNFLHKIFLKIFPHGSQKLGVVARKATLEDIYKDLK
jgi:ubiquinone/menaquinone biosynthesis C-methylase UbiE